MANYEISYTVEKWRKVTLEAASYEEAQEKFWAGDFDFDEVEEYGSEIQDSVEINEVTNNE